MILVVDASAIAAVLFDEPGGDTVRAHCRGETLLAPRLLDYELASVAWKRIRRDPASELIVMAALLGLRSLRIDRQDPPVEETVALAVRTGLTAYDASYLWLAAAHDAELVTLDHRLAAVNQRLREPFAG